MFSKPPSQERRRAERYALRARVSVQQGKNAMELDLVNLSRSGALINLGKRLRPPWLRVGVQVELGLGSDKATIAAVVTGKVVRIVEDLQFYAFAVQFDQYSNSEREGLDTLLANARIYNAGPPPLPSP